MGYKVVIDGKTTATRRGNNSEAMDRAYCDYLRYAEDNQCNRKRIPGALVQLFHNHELLMERNIGRAIWK